MDICLDDIRVKLAELEDKEMSMNIIDYLNHAEKLKKERDEEIKKLANDNAKLLAQNTTLYARAVASNIVPLPKTDIDEEAIINHFSNK